MNALFERLKGEFKDVMEVNPMLRKPRGWLLISTNVIDPPEGIFVARLVEMHPPSQMVTTFDFGRINHEFVQVEVEEKVREPFDGAFRYALVWSPVLSSPDERSPTIGYARLLNPHEKIEHLVEEDL